MKIEVNFHRDDPEMGMLTSWELSNFFNSLSSSYYKNELLYSISDRIQDNIDPRNIVVLDNSFKYDSAYESLETWDLSDNDSLKEMYSIGKPISIFPNQDILRINLMFDAFSSINRLFYKQRISRLSRENLIYYTNSIKEGLNEMVSHANDNVSLVERSHVGKKKRNYSAIYNGINEIKEKKIELWEKFKKDKSLIQESIKTERNLEADIKKTEYTRIKAEYFRPFFSRFNSLSRPLVGVYSEHDRTLSILGVKHINRAKRDEEFFDIKSVTHTNPVDILIAVGLSFAIFLYTIGQNNEVAGQLASLDEDLEKYRALNNINYAIVRNEILKNHKSNGDKVSDAIDKNHFDLNDLK